MPFTMPCGHFFRSLLMFAPPPQPQSSTLASGVSSKKRSPHRATGLCPKFIMATIIFPPKPKGLRVFSKNDISHLQILHTRHRSAGTRLSAYRFAASSSHFATGNAGIPHSSICCGEGSLPAL